MTFYITSSIVIGLLIGVTIAYIRSIIANSTLKDSIRALKEEDAKYRAFILKSDADMKVTSDARDIQFRKLQDENEELSQKLKDATTPPVEHPHKVIWTTPEGQKTQSFPTAPEAITHRDQLRLSGTPATYKAA
jgi:hypothetical protein